MLLLDAAQAVGRVAIDLLSFSGHELHEPPGTGALVLRDAKAFEPFLLGGGRQSGPRSGTMDVVGAVALASACASGRPEPSGILLAMGFTEAEAWSSLRLSVSILNTEAGIDRAAEVIADAVAALRRFPLLAGGTA